MNCAHAVPLWHARAADGCPLRAAVRRKPPRGAFQKKSEADSRAAASQQNHKRPDFT